MSRTVSNPSNVVPFPKPIQSFDRRPLSSFWRGLTCLVLVRHGESRSGKAILVSDTGERSKAVWVPKAMVTIEMPSERGILVATMSKAFAEQKDLHPRFIDPDQFNAATAEVLREAKARAARKRNAYCGFRPPTPHHSNRNATA
jgi:hypothetical protein